MQPKTTIRTLALTLPLAALICLAGCDKQGTPGGQKASAQPAEKRGLVSAEKNSFDAVTAKLDKGGQVFVYVSTEQMLEGLSGKISGWHELLSNLPNTSEKERGDIDTLFKVATNLVRNSGLEQVSGVGLSSIAREPGLYYNKMVLHHYPGKGDGYLWSLFGKQPHKLDGLDLLPEKTALAMFSDFDTPLLWSEIKKEVAEFAPPEVSAQFDQLPMQFKQQTGLDLDQVMGSFGGEYGVIVTLDDEKKVSLPIGQQPIEFPAPALAIVAKVNDDTVFNELEKQLKKNAGLISVDKGDLKMRTVPLPIPLPVEVRPTVARSGEYLIFASGDALVQEMVAVKNGKKGFKSSEQFARLSQGVPMQGNSFFYMSDAISKMIRDIQQKAIAMSGKADPAQAAAMQKLFSTAPPASVFAVSANTDEGWVGTGNGTQSLNAAVIAPAVIAPIGLLSAIAIPNFVKARQTAQMNQMMNNLRQLDGAKQQWALENNKASGSVVTDADLASYLHGGKVKPAADEKYILNPIGTAPQVELNSALQDHLPGSRLSLDDLMGARARRARR